MMPRGELLVIGQGSAYVTGYKSASPCMLNRRIMQGVFIAVKVSPL